MIKRIIIFVLAGLTALAEFDSSEQLAEHIVKTRGEPLRQLAGLPEVFVRDFGAHPDDEKNDFPAVQKALAKIASTEGNAVLLFEKGQYIFELPAVAYQAEEPSFLRISRLKNLIVDGQGSVLTVRRPSAGFCEIRESENIIVRNFTVDYDPLPFSQGTVVDMDAEKGWLDVKCDPGFPALDDPLFSAYSSWGMLKDPGHPGKLKQGAPNVLFRSFCKQTGERLYRVQLQALPAGGAGSWLAKGDRYAQVARAAGGCEYFNSRQVTFENITFNACPSSLFIGSGTSYLNVLSCRGQLKGNRLLVNGADGVHCQGARIGPWVEGCEFEGLSDDCLNVYSVPIHIKAVLSPDRFSVTAAERMRTGDTVAFFHPQTGQVLAETEVTAVENDVITVACPVEGLNLAPPGAAFDQRGWKIYDHIYDLSATGNYFVYRNNFMHDGRRFGGFIKASFGLIESNRFERLSDCVFCIQNEPGWPEGFRAGNLVIRGNKASGSAFGGRVPVEVGWQKLGHKSAGIAMQENMYFENNSISALSGPAAVFDCVDGLVLTGNRFESGSPDGALVTGAGTTVRKMEDNVGQSRIKFE